MSNLNVVGISLSLVESFAQAGYMLVPNAHFCVMADNFNSLFCCGCEIKHEEEAGREGHHRTIFECVWSNGFKNPFNHYFSRSPKRIWECFIS